MAYRLSIADETNILILSHQNIIYWRILLIFEVITLSLSLNIDFSYFATRELPNLRVKEVTNLVVLVVHTIGVDSTNL